MLLPPTTNLLFDVIYVVWLRVEHIVDHHRPLVFILLCFMSSHPIHLTPAVLEVCCPRFLFHVAFLGVLCFYGVHFGVCLATLTPLRLRVSKPVRFLLNIGPSLVIVS